MIWNTKRFVQSLKMVSKMWSLDDIPELKTCRLCAAITDDSVELKEDMKNFLVHFLEIEDLPQKICVTCFQDCCDAKRFKERCRKAFEKLSKLEKILPQSFMLGMPINDEARTNPEFFSFSKIFQGGHIVHSIFIVEVLQIFKQHIIT